MILQLYCIYFEHKETIISRKNNIIMRIDVATISQVIMVIRPLKIVLNGMIAIVFC
jgi:hypothetical protein